MIEKSKRKVVIQVISRVVEVKNKDGERVRRKTSRSCWTNLHALRRKSVRSCETRLREGEMSGIKVTSRVLGVTT